MASRVWTAAQRRRLGRRLSELADADIDAVLAFWRSEGAAARLARRVGFTGPPGAGKSTLLGQLATMRGCGDARLGVLAIDPSSPLSGGAILGDRVRMDSVQGIDRVFVRSIASRSAQDGLAQNLPELLAAMDCAGCDEVLVETVGVGQVGCAVHELVDTVVLVLAPGAGDVVQAMKAGLIELADIVVVNQADRPDAERLAHDVMAALRGRGAAGSRVAMVRTSNQEPASIAQLSHAIDAHQAALDADGRGAARQRDRDAYRLRSLIERLLAEGCQSLPAALLARPLPQQIGSLLRRLAAPYPDDATTDLLA